MSEQDRLQVQNAGSAGSARPAYEPPTVRVMNEEEVLRAFQVTAAGAMISTNWWTS